MAPARPRSIAAALVLFALAAPAAQAVTAPVLDIAGQSLTDILQTHKTPGQDLLPRYMHRGVGPDGSLFKPSPLGWAIHGDAVGGSYSSGRSIGDLDLYTGDYAPTEVDIALPSPGLPLVIGRTYNGWQHYNGGRSISAGYQGNNWAQVAMPAVRFKAGATTDKDVVTLIYGADRYIEFQRVTTTSNEFKAKNGAAGVLVRAAETFGVGAQPETYTYYDQRGNKAVFLGYAATPAVTDGQMVSYSDPGGNTVYVGTSSSDPATQKSSGFDGSGRVTLMYDAAGRKYTFHYSGFGGVDRLDWVKAQQDVSGTWTDVAKVEYDYYTTWTSGLGDVGDLRMATVTTYGTNADYVRSKYYRYYNNWWTDSNGSRGSHSQLKLVVGYEGVRAYPSSLDSATDAQLLSYSDVYLEYVSGSDYRVKRATFNGVCGCSGGAAGQYTLTYGEHASHATYVGNTAYDDSWDARTVIEQPDTTFVTQYFDEAGQPLSRVVTSGDPAGSPAKKWVTGVERDAGGVVTSVHSPANVDTYTHSSGAITYKSGDGLITVYGPRTTSDNLKGLLESVSVRKGTGNPAVAVRSQTLTDHQFTLTDSGVSLPLVSEWFSYPTEGGGGLSSEIDLTNSTWWGTSTARGYLARKKIITKHPLVSTGNNGSNTRTSTVACHREDGTVAFTIAQDGIVTYSGRNAYGLTTIRIADCDVSSGDILTPDVASTWSISNSGPGSPAPAKTTYTYDLQGRPLTATMPSVASTRTAAWVYEVHSGLLSTMASPRLASGTYYGPVAHTRVNHAGKTVRTDVIQASGSMPTLATVDGNWSAMVEHIYDATGTRLEQTFTYTTDSSTHDTSAYAYDAMGRRIRSLDATGTITRLVYDERGKPIERWVGTNDNGLPGGSVSGSSNMTKVEAMEYDAGASGGGGNGLLTKRTLDPDGDWTGGNTDKRETVYSYDFRGRAYLTANPAPPHQLTKYDNLDRVIAVGLAASTSSLPSGDDPTASSWGNRRALTETAYDERGQVFRTTRHKINQSSGAKEDMLVADTWYDAAGRPIKTHGERITKTTYDRLGRVTGSFLIGLCLTSSSEESGYGDADDLDYDIVLEETRHYLDAGTGRPLTTLTVQRPHNDATTDDALYSGTVGATVTASSILGRAQMTSFWYDGWDRVVTTAAVGDNGGGNYTRGSVPARSDTVLRTDTAYDGFGRVYQVFDPQGSSGVQTRTTYDFGGRRTRVVGNYTNDVAGGGADNDQDQVTAYVYTNGLVTSVTREMPSSSDNQTTTYEYGTTKGSGLSKVATGHLLRKTVLPEQVTSQAAADRTYAQEYNALGQVIKTTDPAGNVIQTAYDAGGRPTARTATTIASGFDGSVDAVSYAYDALGRLSAAGQSGPGSFESNAEMGYDGWGNLANEFQEPDENAGHAYIQTDFNYSKNSTAGGWRRTYLSSSAQPGGVALSYDHGSGLDLAVRRAAGVSDGSVTVASYEYMGAASAVTAHHPEPAVGTELYDGSDYRLDLFNRPTAMAWVAQGMAGPAFVDFAMTYRRLGQPEQVTDHVLTDASPTPVRRFDQEWSYDALRRAKQRTEGELDPGGGGISTQSREEILARSITGRIVQDSLTLNADSDYTDGPPNSIGGRGEMNDARTYNKRNELLTRTVYDSSYPSTPKTVTLGYDKNGNLTDDGELYEYVYNPWGQLVKVLVKEGPTVVAVYGYDALGRRVREQLDTNDALDSGEADGVADAYDPVFYVAVDPQGRRLATYRGTDSDPKETFVWHAAGLSGPALRGGLILRDRDAACQDPTQWATAAASSTRAERYYYCADFQGSVMALITHDGKLVEQARYSATGVPFGLPLGDVDADGDCDEDDETAVSAYLGESPPSYRVGCDLDVDGNVDADDVVLSVGNTGFILGRIDASMSASRSVVVGADREWQHSLAFLLTISTFMDPAIDRRLSSSSTRHQQLCNASAAPRSALQPGRPEPLPELPAKPSGDPPPDFPYPELIPRDIGPFDPLNPPRDPGVEQPEDGWPRPLPYIEPPPAGTIQIPMQFPGLEGQCGAVTVSNVTNCKMTCKGWCSDLIKDPCKNMPGPGLESEARKECPSGTLCEMPTVIRGTYRISGRTTIRTTLCDLTCTYSIDVTVEGYVGQCMPEPVTPGPSRIAGIVK